MLKLRHKMLTFFVNRVILELIKKNIGGENVMDQIMEMLGKIDFEKIIATVTDIVKKIEESGIIDKIVEFVKGLIG